MKKALLLVAITLISAGLVGCPGSDRGGKRFIFTDGITIPHPDIIMWDAPLDVPQDVPPVTACDVDDHCPDGEYCLPDLWVCVDCYEDGHCGDNEVCIAEECVPAPPCGSDEDCPEGQVCDPDLGLCVECAGDWDCPDGFVCVDHVCELADPPCLSDEDCPEDLHCDVENNLCQECLEDDHCEDSEWCDPGSGTCRDDLCVPGSKECVGGGVKECKESGAGYMETVPCPEGSHCSGGECVPDLNCVPGESHCINEIELEICTDDGLQWELVDCALLAVKSVCEAGECVPLCEPDCSGVGANQCGPDGCGDMCLFCAPDTECPEGAAGLPPGEAAFCEGGCSCEGKECGDDGCGGLCGECGPGFSCQNYTCIPGGLDCGEGFQCMMSCNAVPNDECIAGCLAMTDVENQDLLGEFAACIASYCGGEILPGCAAEVAKTACQKFAWECLGCQPDCQNKECGDDGCEGSCGACPDNFQCIGGKCQCSPSCSGKQCGDDGCGGLCGLCMPGADCIDFQCISSATCGAILACIETSPFPPDESIPACMAGGSEQAQDDFLALATCVQGACGEFAPGSPCYTVALQTECEKEWAQCGECIADCAGKECGPDGCGDFCGSCPNGYGCNNGKCECVSNCGGKACGSDGCGGVCGTCGPNESCLGGQCVVPPTCKEMLECATGCFPGDDCFDACSEAATGQELAEFEVLWECAWEICAPSSNPTCLEIAIMDECYGYYLACVACEPTCILGDMIMECGPDGCGGACGACPANSVCEDGKCQPICVPICQQQGKECGDDGCGGLCGVCKPGYNCIVGHCECQANCLGKMCGDDGCGGSCGICPPGMECFPGGVCQPGGFCGDNFCDKEGGEDPLNCPEDCGPYSDGCTETEWPGCGGCPCEACVCAIDPFCCEFSWDSLCVQECEFDCGGCCAPDCAGKECGSDGCGGSCGSCPANHECKNDQCIPVCVPDCDGKECGSDDCGGLCGTCPGGATCLNYSCFVGLSCDQLLQCGIDCLMGEGVACLYNCLDQGTPEAKAEFSALLMCGAMSCGLDLDPNCWLNIITGGGGCQAEYNNCAQCTPNCTNKDCGPDGCGGSCGVCQDGYFCDNYKCKGICNPSCQEGGIPFECGSNGCGGSCGTCPAMEECINHQCEPVCVPNCIGKECGSDDCGGQCGFCLPGEICQGGICTPVGPVCGDNICDVWEGEDCETCAIDCGGCGAGCVATPWPGCNGCPCEQCVCGMDPFCCQNAWDDLCVQECYDCGGCECEPDCSDVQCGDDGCGGSCGDCPDEFVCVDGECTFICVPECLDKQCGPDGCGGSCGSCPVGFYCTAEALCEKFCNPDCQGKECGPDGCNGQCGLCGPEEACLNGLCVQAWDCGQLLKCLWDCPEDDDVCYDGCWANASPEAQEQYIGIWQCLLEVCGPEPTDDCTVEAIYGGGECTDVYNACLDCTPNCTGKQCGPDECGGSCGTCPPGFTCDGFGFCDCLPQCIGKECGSDSCGGICGVCPDGFSCNPAGKCSCMPQCLNKECGSDGCGGTCGQCPADHKCDDGLCIPDCIPDCGGKECGADGCGGVCGSCAFFQECFQGLCWDGPEWGCNLEVFEEHLYAFCDFGENISWHQAQDNCVAWGGKLVVLDNQWEHQFVQTFIGGTLYWLGLTDMGQEGEWMWLDGKPAAAYVDWCGNEPNNSNNEDCALGNWTPEQGCFNDCRCDWDGCIAQAYICETATNCEQGCAGLQCGGDGCGGVCDYCEEDLICSPDGDCLPVGPECGDDICEAGEDCGSCPVDCGSCGLCKISGSMTCGSAIAGSTENGEAGVNEYSCVGGNYAAPELAYKYVATCNGLLTIKLDKLSPDGSFLDILILDGDSGVCDGALCLDYYWMADNHAEGVLDIEAGHAYYIVVDGWNDTEGDFSLSIDCECICTPECGGKECGDDGCGGSCGACPGNQECVNGICEGGLGQLGDPCVKGVDCESGLCLMSDAGKVCSQYCNDGQCPPPFSCIAVPIGGGGVINACLPCGPNCAGKECGDDCCGGSCGQCAGNEQCVDGTCEADLGKFGDPCQVGAQCESGLCIAYEGGKICTIVCGGDGDCPNGYSCQAVGAGGLQVCLPAPDLGEFGDPCSVGAECESGLCIAYEGGKICTIVCGGDGDCPNGYTCQAVGGAGLMVCLPAPDPGKFGDPCLVGADCESGLCIAYEGGKMCTTACGGNGDCPDGYTCQAVGGGGVKVCLPAPEPGQFGDDCVVGADCESGLCIAYEDGKMCTSVCGGDGDCPNGYTCQAVGGGGLKVCLPPVELGQFGDACAVGADCESGLCIAYEGGKICTSACGGDGDCPDGYTCQDVGGGLKVCLPAPEPGQFGDDCLKGADCESGLCIAYEGGKICTTACGGNGDCPNGYTCQGVGPGLMVCLPGEGD